MTSSPWWRGAALFQNHDAPRVATRCALGDLVRALQWVVLLAESAAANT
jgi:hypothetical protein